MTADSEYAGVAVRLSALALDVIVMSLVFFPVARVVKGTWLVSAPDHRWVSGWFVTDPLCLVFLVVMFLYFVLFEGTAGATPGKRVLGLRVVGRDGAQAGIGRALLRNVLRPVDSLPALGILGAVLIATSRERTRLGDRAAETRVVRVRNKLNLTARMFGAGPPRSTSGRRGDRYESGEVLECCDLCSSLCAICRTRGPCCGSTGPGRCCDAALLAQRCARTAAAGSLGRRDAQPGLHQYQPGLGDQHQPLLRPGPHRTGDRSTGGPLRRHRA